ncbi:MAG: spore germination protein [Eubacteriaceae bacterium]
MKHSNFEKTVSILQSKNMDLKERSISYHKGMMKIFYIAQLTDRTRLSENVIKPLVLHCSDFKKAIDAQMTIESVIYADDCMIEQDASKIEAHILSGMVVILFSTDDNYIVINLRKVEHRAVTPPQLNYTIRGPQDCFTENIDTNLSLIRYRIKDKNIIIENFEVGQRTKARVALIYIKDIANNNVISDIKKRIEDIDVDGIYESGELQKLLLKNKFNFFPTIGLVERSDMACSSLIEGKVIILVDGSEIALMLPKTFNEFFYSCDDRYDNKYFAQFSRILRYVCLLVALTASSLYVAVVSFHTDILPVEYAISLSQMRSSVPFNSLIGVLLLEFIAELLREALLRVPKQIGPAIGIVGAIVIGQAATSAGIFSPLLLILVATALLASFALPDYSLMNPFRILKLFLILFTGSFGLFGFTLFLTAVLVELVSTNSFGVAYMAPWAPFNKHDFKNSILSDPTTDKLRPKYLQTKDKKRINNSKQKKAR